METNTRNKIRDLLKKNIAYTCITRVYGFTTGEILKALEHWDLEKERPRLSSKD